MTYVYNRDITYQPTSEVSMSDYGDIPEEVWKAHAAYHNTQPQRTPTNQSTSPPTTQPTNQRGKYPWNVWQDGKYHVLTRGTDFEVAVGKMQMQIYRRATDTDMVVRTERLEGGLGVLFASSITELNRRWALYETDPQTADKEVPLK